MTPTEAQDRVIEALSVVWAKPTSDIADEVKTKGLEVIMVSSHEVVAVLVLLKSAGIDPNDRNVLTGCNLQNLQQLVSFITAQAATP
jgi:predicted mannosyl-3-phosphoglycerate phosphatase (HAD superfamily)